MWKFLVMPCTAAAAASSSSSFSQKSKNLFSLLSMLASETIAPVPEEKKETSHERRQTIAMFFLTFLGVVCIRKLTPARVHTGMIFWYRIAFIWWLGHFTSRYLKVEFMLIKYTRDPKSQALRMPYPFQATGRPISHRNGWSFRVYMIPLRDFVSEWNSRPGARTGVNSRRGDSRQHEICGGIM